MRFYTVINGTVVKGYDFLIDAQEDMAIIINCLPAGYRNEVSILDDKGSVWDSNMSMVGRA